MSCMMYFLYACGILCSASSFHDLPLSVLSFNLPTVHMSVSFFISSQQLVTTGTIQELRKHLANRLYMYITIYIYKYDERWNKLQCSLVTSCWNYSPVWRVIPNLFFEAYNSNDPWWMQWSNMIMACHWSIDPHPFQDSHDPKPMHLVKL